MAVNSDTTTYRSRFVVKDISCRPEFFTCRHWQPKRHATLANTCFRPGATPLPGLPRSIGHLFYSDPSIRRGLSGSNGFIHGLEQRPHDNPHRVRIHETANPTIGGVPLAIAAASPDAIRRFATVSEAVQQRHRALGKLRSIVQYLEQSDHCRLGLASG